MHRVAALARCAFPKESPVEGTLAMEVIFTPPSFLSDQVLVSINLIIQWRMNRLIAFVMPGAASVTLMSPLAGVSSRSTKLQ